MNFRVQEIVLALLLAAAVFAVLAVLRTAGMVPMSELLNSISWSSVASIIFGAAISAIVAFILQKKSFAEARQIREADRKEKRQAIGYSLLFKMLRISSDLINLRNSVNDALKNLEKDGLLKEPFQVVTPSAALPDQVNFSVDEMALLLSLDANLFNEMAAIDAQHKSIIALFAEYNERRTTTLERFGAKMEGYRGVTMLTKEQNDWLAPRAALLNSLIETIQQRTDEHSKFAWTSLERLCKVLNDKLDVRHRLEKVTTF